MKKDVVSALAEIGSPSVEPLVKLLRETRDSSLQKTVIAILRKLKDERVAEELMKLLREREDESLQKNLISALVEMGTFSAESFIELLEWVKDGSLQNIGITILGELRDERAVEPLTELLGETRDISLQETVLSALTKIGSPSVEPLIEQLSKAEYTSVKKRILSALTKIGSPSIKPLVKCQRKTGDNSLRMEILSILEEMKSDMGKSKDRGAAEFLIELLEETEDKSIQLSIIAALGKSKDRGAAEFLIELLEETEDKSIQLSIIAALGELKDERAAEPLANLLGEAKNVSFQETVLSVLIEIGSPSVNPLIEQLKKVEHTSVKKRIISALREITDKKTVESLMQLLE